MVEACETVSGFGTNIAAIYAQDWMVVTISECEPYSHGYFVQAFTLINFQLPLSKQQSFAWSLATSRSSGGAVGIQDMALTSQALHDWLGVTRFGGSRCVCPGERRLRDVVHDQDLSIVDRLCSVVHLVSLLIHVLFILATFFSSFLQVVSLGGDQVLHKSNIIPTNLTIQSE